MNPIEIFIPELIGQKYVMEVEEEESAKISTTNKKIYMKEK
jgi:hypothetical protein